MYSRVPKEKVVHLDVQEKPENLETLVFPVCLVCLDLLDPLQMLLHSFSSWPPLKEAEKRVLDLIPFRCSRPKLVLLAHEVWQDLLDHLDRRVSKEFEVNPENKVPLELPVLLVPEVFLDCPEKM